MEFLAHINETEKELLIDHLLSTAELASSFGAKFGNSFICRQLGLLHDIGKHTENFQKVLSGQLIKQDHAILAGIKYAKDGKINNKWLKKQLGLIMAGHHSTLYSDRAEIGQDLFIKNAIENIINCSTKDNNKTIALSSIEEWNDIEKYIKDNELIIDIPDDEYFDIKSMSKNEKMFYIRMLYSCLVDADYTATASFEDKDYIKTSEGLSLNTDVLLEQLNRYHDMICKNSKSDSGMNNLRNMIYDACTRKGKTETGFVTLTAPTGTGKTLALMKFALEQAKAYNKSNIIIVLPYLSIINQNAMIYREIFGEDVVLVDDSQTEYNDITRLYSDRWSSPIIVTTSVKFFETLFTSKPTDIRRLHRLSNSVIVFDECQTLPSNVLNSSLEILNALTTHYNSTVLFSTATKPSYEYRNKTITSKSIDKNEVLDKLVANFKWNATEIIDNIDNLFNRYNIIKNTHIEFDINDTYYTNDMLIDYFHENQIMFTFNTVKHATEMYQTLIQRHNPEDCYLITSNFCAIDKLAIIDEISEKLKNNQPVYLAATQCVEAGVDFDFPAGAREYAPWESVIQSLGRVNRNGLKNGKFLVFMYEKHTIYDYPSESYKWASQMTENIAKINDLSNVYSTDIMDKYFAKLYQSVNYSDDKPKLVKDMLEENYAALSDDYKIIENSGQAIILVRPHAGFDDYDELINDIINNDYTITSQMMRQLAGCTVAIYKSKSFNPNNISVQLSFRRHADSKTNWYLLSDDTLYTQQGLIF